MRKTFLYIVTAVLLVCAVTVPAAAVSCDDFDFTPPDGFAEIKQVIPGSYAWQNAEEGSSISLVVQDNAGHFDNTTLDAEGLKSFSADYEEQYKSSYASLGDKGYTVDFTVDECSVKRFGEYSTLYLQSLLKLTAEGKTQKKTQYCCSIYRENKTYTLTYLVSGTREQGFTEFSLMASALTVKDEAYVPREGYAGVIVISVFACAAVCVLVGAAAVYVNKKKRLEQEEAEREAEKGKNPAVKKEKKKKH